MAAPLSFVRGLGRLRLEPTHNAATRTIRKASLELPAFPACPFGDPWPDRSLSSAELMAKEFSDEYRTGCGCQLRAGYAHVHGRHRSGPCAGGVHSDGLWCASMHGTLLLVSDTMNPFKRVSEPPNPREGSGSCASRRD